MQRAGRRHGGAPATPPETAAAATTAATASSSAASPHYKWILDTIDSLHRARRGRTWSASPDGAAAAAQAGAHARAEQRN